MQRIDILLVLENFRVISEIHTVLNDNKFERNIFVLFLLYIFHLDTCPLSLEIILFLTNRGKFSNEWLVVESLLKLQDFIQKYTCDK